MPEDTMIEIIPWSTRPLWLRRLCAIDDDVAPLLTDHWWWTAFTLRNARWESDSVRHTMHDRAAYDPRLVLLGPLDGEAEILAVNDELFDYGTQIYWTTTAETPQGPRLIALLTDS